MADEVKQRDRVDKATTAHYLVVYAGPRCTIDRCQRRVWSRHMGLHPAFHTKRRLNGNNTSTKWHVGAVILDYLSASLSFRRGSPCCTFAIIKEIKQQLSLDCCEAAFDLFCQDTKCVQRDSSYLPFPALILCGPGLDKMSGAGKDNSKGVKEVKGREGCIVNLWCLGLSGWLTISDCLRNIKLSALFIFKWIKEGLFSKRSTVTKMVCDDKSRMFNISQIQWYQYKTTMINHWPQV